jgi:hypothetical protein
MHFQYFVVIVNLILLRHFSGKVELLSAHSMIVKCVFRDDEEEDDNPETKVVREKVRRQANNARERSVIYSCFGTYIRLLVQLNYEHIS